MQDLRAYKLARENLLWDVLGLAGLIGSVLPAEARAGSKFARAGGSQWHNYDLMTVSKKLQDVLYRFDQVQHALGLPHPEDARFGHPPAGSTNQSSDENPPIATPKKYKPKSAPATK